MWELRFGGDLSQLPVFGVRMLQLLAEFCVLPSLPVLYGQMVTEINFAEKSIKRFGYELFKLYILLFFLWGLLWPNVGSCYPLSLKMYRCILTI